MLSATQRLSEPFLSTCGIIFKLFSAFPISLLLHVDFGVIILLAGCLCILSKLFNSRPALVETWKISEVKILYHNSATGFKIASFS